MGKPWLLYKVAGDGGSSSANKKAAGKSRKRGGERLTPASSSSSSFGGCMSAILNIFDVHHYHHLPFHQPSLITESSVNNNITEEPNIILKGAEAPRNSLEVEDASSSPPSSSSLKFKQETNFKIPMRDIQINTKRSKVLTDDISSECSSSSPSTKTPTLVARLMGLDLLPENSSPRVSSSSSSATPINPLLKLSSKYNSTRSLPTTPRLSTGDIRSRPSMDADYHHRLSLQVNKENKRRYDENSSEYAKQIAKQIRENISRRVAGADITNTGKSKEHRRDEFLVVLKPNRSLPQSTANAVNKSRNLDQGHVFGKENYEPTSLSNSARLRLMEIKNNLNKPNSSLRSSPLSSNSEAIKSSSPLMKEVVMKQEKPIMKVQKCKKIASEKYDLRLKKLHQQDQETCMKKCNKKSTPLSNQLVKVKINTTKFMSSKKDIASSSSSKTLPQKQNIKDTHKLTFQDKVSANGNSNGKTAVTGSSNSDYINFISKILSYTGIENTTLISISHWYSPSHPLHPSIFQQIENQCHPTASADRKLIFAVVDELLVDILKPYISLKPWVGISGRNSHRMCGSELIGILCEKIGSFPAADCQVLEDIDGLIEGDMRNSTRLVGETAFAEEAEELVTEMERDVVDTLVGEVAGMILHVRSKGIWSNDIY